MEGTPLATGILSSSLAVGRDVINLVPDVEVSQKAPRQKFTAENKRNNTVHYHSPIGFLTPEVPLRKG